MRVACVAILLSEQRVPFILASGYADAPGAGLGAAPVLQKPFSGDAPIGLIRDTWKQSDG